jgi:hypothetical protein
VRETGRRVGRYSNGTSRTFQSPTGSHMLPALALLIACYTTFRFLETLTAKDTTVLVRVAGVVLLLLSFVSCSVATFGGAKP